MLDIFLPSTFNYDVTKQNASWVKKLQHNVLSSSNDVPDKYLF